MSGTAMSTDGPTLTLIDTSVLINFLAVDRASLLAARPQHRYVVTDHVRGEVDERSPERLERFERALQEGVVEATTVSSLAELELFAFLQATNRLGEGG